VTMTTRSYRAGSAAIRWTCSGDEQYEIGAGERTEVGTTIEMRLKPAAAFLLQPGLLIDTIRRYADFLPVPIYVDGDPVPVNFMMPPWEAPGVEHVDRDRAVRAYLAHAGLPDDPLAIIHLEDHVVDLGHDRLSIPLRGFLYVPPVSFASVREYGDLRVYIRRMFIRDGERGSCRAGRVSSAASSSARVSSRPHRARICIRTTTSRRSSRP
jgi:molecular chaperone HtpG